MKLSKSGSLASLGLVLIMSAVSAKPAAFPENGIKKPVDHSVYEKWNTIGGYRMTDDGRYVLYCSSREQGDGFVEIIDLEADKRFVVERGAKALIAQDGKHVICTVEPFVSQQKASSSTGLTTPRDTLCIVSLKDWSCRMYPSAGTLSVPERGHFFAFGTEGADRTGCRDALFIYDLRSDSVKDTIQGVVRAFPDKDGANFFYSRNTVSDTGKKGVYVYNVLAGASTVVMEGPSSYAFSNPVLSDGGDMIAFYAKTDTAKKWSDCVEIYTYKAGADSAVMVVDNDIAGLPQGWRISMDTKVAFNGDATRLFFGIAPVSPTRDGSSEKELASLDIWHYNDDYLQTQQKLSLKEDLKQTYLSYVNLDSEGKLPNCSKGMVQLAYPDYKDVKVPARWNADWAYALSTSPYAIQSQWNADPVADLYVMSIDDPEPEILIKGGYFYSLEASPDGKYLIWFDPEKGHWFSYSRHSGKIRNVSEKIAVPLWNELDDTPAMAGPYGYGGWREKDGSFFIYDKYDVWEVDPACKKSPKMITGGLGRVKDYTFRITRPADWSGAIKDDASLFFRTFDNRTKGYGYYIREFESGRLKPMRELVMYQDLYLGNLLKAKDSNRMTFVKSSFSVAPRLCMTDDYFVTCKELVNSNPQQDEYNWGTCELVSWTSLDGRQVEGQLFKPENFDPEHKYPMIVYVYEKDSHNKNQYRRPAVSRSILNVIYFVSNGYLVFIPDIHYTVGHPGKSVYDCVIPGVRSLCRYPWVDKENIGLQGHSWGGCEAAYLISHTDMFKCAMTGAPVVNMTSAYGGIRLGTGAVREYQYEDTQSRIGCSLWDDGGLALYIENSALFAADKINTPVLILHNDNDEAVPWSQGVEFFTALRRLGKKVWMLQYDNEKHSLKNYVNAYDYTIRLAQFMDHFLKDAPMPVWMKYGVPARMKGIDSGLELAPDSL